MLPHIGKNFCSLRNSSKMVAFNSLIVFDIETTGLPHLENNNTRITELAMMGCEVEHLKNATSFPRVLHKMVFCYNPMKVILPDSSKVSGLENELLMNNKPFSQADADMLTHFVNRLPSPVCMIAHNGNKFDFPILQRHLHKLNAKLPENVYCADSLKAFQEIYPNNKQYSNENKKINFKSENEEITPIKRKSSSVTNEIELIKVSKLNMPKVCKNLFPGSPETKSDNDESENSETTSSKSNSPLKYNLSSIYQFLHGKSYIGGHRAEEDAKALLSCIIKCDEFLNWMNEKAVSFNSIKPLL